MANGTPISPVLTDNGSVEDLGPGGVLNQLPSLKKQGEISRLDNIKFNEYNGENGQMYGAGHPNAQSDGDEFGRGEVNPAGGVGTKTDKQRKDVLLYSSGNKFKPGKGYYNFDYNEEYW
jgi:hypothetical protein